MVTRMESRVEFMEDVVMSVQGELGVIKQELQKIPNLEQGIAALMKKLDQVVQTQEEAKRENGILQSLMAGKTPKQTDGPIDGNHGREMKLNTRWDLRPRQIKLSSFNGENLDDWILKAERYFVLHRMTNTKKLETITISFEGEALIWFGWENQRRPFLN
ncbi:hypothetical protein AB3S75_031074 [Citrus x aurantiifolia]